MRPLLVLELHNPECDRAAWDFSQQHNYSLKSLHNDKEIKAPEEAEGTLLCSPRDQ